MKKSGNWVTPEQFAASIGTSVSFVRRRLCSGDLPHRSIPAGGGRLIHRKHVARFDPYQKKARLFSTKDAMAQTGLSKQTICDLLHKGCVSYTQTDRRGRYCRKTVLLAGAKPVKRWVIPEETVRALLCGIRPNIEEWPTAAKVAQHSGCSIGYVLKLYEAGRIRGQQSIIRCKVHIHPKDAAALGSVGEYRHSIKSVSERTGLAAQTIGDIVRRGYFRQRYTDSSREVVAEYVRIHARKRLGRYWFSEEGLGRFLQGVRPFLMRWPTARDIENRLGLSRGTVSRYFNEGRIRGCSSVKGQGGTLHVDPSDLKHLVSQKKYCLPIAAERFKVPIQVLREWNRCSSLPFLKRGLGRWENVPPHILGRMRFLAEHNALTKETSEIIASSLEEFRRHTQRILFHTVVYNADRPPPVSECREGMHIVFPDHRCGVIARVRKNRYRPAIEVILPDEPVTEQRHLYAVAGS